MRESCRDERTTGWARRILDPGMVLVLSLGLLLQSAPSNRSAERASLMIIVRGESSKPLAAAVVELSPEGSTAGSVGVSSPPASARNSSDAVGLSTPIVPPPATPTASGKVSNITPTDASGRSSSAAPAESSTKPRQAPTSSGSVTGARSADTGPSGSTSGGRSADGTGRTDASGKDEQGISARPEPTEKLPPASDREAGATMLRRSSDAEGRIVFRGLAAGRYRVTVEAPGYLSRQMGSVLIPSGADQKVIVDLEPGTAVEGKVQGPGGKPVAGASLCLHLNPAGGPTSADSDGSGSVDGRVCTRSASDGGIALPAIRRGRYTLRIAAAGLAPLVRSLDLSKPPGVQTWTLGAGGAVTGRVVDHAEHGVAGARVSLEDRLRTTLDGDRPTSKTKADGRFLVKGLAPGSWRIEIEPAEAELLSVDGIEVKDGGTVDIGLLRASAGSVLSGRVVSTAGEPAPGARLRVQERGGAARFLRESKSGDDGRFRVAGLPSGEFDLVVVPVKGLAPRREEKIRVPQSDLEVRVEPAGSIAGRVVLASGAIPPRISVTATTHLWHVPGAGNLSTTTDEVDPDSGRFAIEGVIPGGVEVRAQAEGYACEPVVVQVEPAHEAGPVELTLQRGVGVEGRVVDRDGNGIAGAAISSEGGQTAASDVNGEFRLDGLRPVMMKIDVTHPDFASWTGRVAPPLAEGERLLVSLGRGGAVEGRVTDDDGAPVEGVPISLDDELPRALTDSSGHYRIDHLGAGSHHVARRGADANDVDQRSVEVAEGETATVDFRLGKILEGRVTQGGAPVAGAFLSIAQPRDWSKGVGGEYSVAHTYTDADGRFSLSGAPSGWATATIVAGALQVQRLVNVPPGHAAHLDLPVPDQEIRGRVVTKSSAKPMPGVQVSSHPPGPADAPHSTSTISGTAEDSLGQTFAFALSTSDSIETHTDADGRFTVFLDGGSKQMVSAFTRGYEYESVAVDPGKDKEVTIEMVGAVKVLVRLTDGSGRSVVESRVCFIQVRGTGCQTNDGSETEVQIEEGSYTLTAGSPGFATQVFANREAKVDPEGRTETIDVVLRPGVALRVRLPGSNLEKAKAVSFRDAAGRNLAVLLHDAGVDAKTGEHRWTSDPLEAGDYTIVVDLGDGKSISKTTTVVLTAENELLLP